MKPLSTFTLAAIFAVALQPLPDRYFVYGHAALATVTTSKYPPLHLAGVKEYKTLSAAKAERTRRAKRAIV